MKTHLLITRWIGRSVALLSFSFFMLSSVQAQECACKQGVNVALGSNGQATVTPAMMLASNSTCAGTHVVTVMKTPNGQPIPGSPVVNCTHVGQTLYAKVSNGSNSCWGSILVMDELAPVITPQPGITRISCVAMTNFTPIVTDNCPGAEAVLVNESIMINLCQPGNGLATDVLKRITRTYRATDNAGNVSPDVVFVFDVTVIDDLGDIDMPQNYSIMNNTALDCAGPWAKIPAGKPYAGNPSPTQIGLLSGTGVPSINGSALYPEGNEHCNISVGFTDVVLSTPDCVVKIVRTWQVLEWSCANRSIAPHSQLIEITDTQAPALTVPANITVSTTNHVCEASVVIPPVSFTDNCSLAGDITVDVVYPGGFIDNKNGGLVSLPVGDHAVTYIVYDKCHNSSTGSMIISVRDHTPPVAICDEYTTVTLNQEGEAYVPASVLDDGSYDECSPVKMLVRRMNNTNCGTCDLPEFPGFHYMGEYGSGADKRYYYLSQHTSTPEVAFKMAKAMGGNVVTIDSPAKDAWLWSRFLALVPNAFLDWTNMIIGLNDLNRDGIYTWQSGSTSTYRNWNAGVPVNAPSPYVVKYHDALGRWFDYSPAYAAKYVVEITDPCSWSNAVDFCCLDVPNEQMVSFRAIDAAGNFNDCMVSVRIQDKIGPTLTCPPNMERNCDFAFTTDDLVTPFGWPVAVDNCEQLTIEEINVQNTLNSCRIGSIVRNFEVTDAGGRSATCTQTITFDPVSPFTQAGITWPLDYMNLEGCADPKNPAFTPDVLGRPTFADGACALVGADFEDKVFSFNNGAGPACFKILRYWTVIDWCQPITTPSGTSYATWTHTQTIVVNDNVAPTIAALEPQVTACTYDAACLEGHIELGATATDNCTQTLAHSWKIDANNDGTFEPSLQYTGVGGSIDASGIFPVGTHKIVYSFEDKCGNVTSREQLFTIVNCKTPTAICHNGLSVNLTPMDTDNDGNIDTGMATVDVNKFNKGSQQACGIDNLLFSFEPITIVNGNPVLVQDILFDCNDIGDQPIQMYVGIMVAPGQINQSFCSTFIEVQDNLGACEGRLIGGNISGRIATSTSETVEAVEVSLGGSELKFNTEESGFYAFANLPLGFDYKVNPKKDDDVLNGISTLDLVIIQRHILDIEGLQSPYKLIAADVNKDQAINSLDLVELRKVILGTQLKFNGNTSWRFIDGQYKFIDPLFAHTENFVESTEILNFSKDMAVDFVAVKTGDVNESVVANASTQKNTNSRSIINLTTPQQKVKTGDLVTIPVHMTQEMNLTGMQFTIHFDASTLELVQINHGMTSDDNFGFTNLSDGDITFSWNDASGFSFRKDDLLTSLVFRAKRDGNVTDMFEINSSLLKAESYDNQNNVFGLSWKTENVQPAFVVHQNIPNPFSQTTTISFELPEAGNVVCSVRDMGGKMIKEISQYFDAGTQSIAINKSELPSSGVYYYTVQTGNYRETKMMVVIE